MQIAQLQALVAVARAGSFRAAARQLGRSQPSLTRDIQQIEDALAGALFHRASTGVRLTELGTRMHRRALSVLAELERLTDEAAQIRALQCGAVRIGVSPAAATALLPRALKRFRRDWPEVEVEALNVLFPEAAQMLRDARLDMVLGPIPDALSDTALTIEDLARLSVQVAAHAKNPRRHAQSLAELDDAPWIAHGPAGGPSALFADGLPGGAARPQTRCHSLTALMAMLVDTDGVCFLSDMLLAELAGRYELVRIPVQDPLPCFRLALLSRAASPLTPAAEALAGHFRTVATSPGRLRAATR